MFDHHTIAITTGHSSRGLDGSKTGLARYDYMIVESITKDGEHLMVKHTGFAFTQKLADAKVARLVARLQEDQAKYVVTQTH